MLSIYQYWWILYAEIKHALPCFDFTLYFMAVCNLDLTQYLNKSHRLKLENYDNCWVCSIPGVSKLRPAGQMRPAKPFYPAREAILSMMKKYYTVTYEKFVDVVEYNISRNNHIA